MFIIHCPCRRRSIGPLPSCSFSSRYLSSEQGEKQRPQTGWKDSEDFWYISAMESDLTLVFPTQIICSSPIISLLFIDHAKETLFPSFRRLPLLTNCFIFVPHGKIFVHRVLHDLGLHNVWWYFVHFIMSSTIYRLVQLNLTPEIQAFHMLFDISLTPFSMSSLKQHME